MNKQKILLLLLLFTGLTGNIQFTNAANFDSINLKENNILVIKGEKVNNFKKNKKYNDDGITNNFNLINIILDKQIKELVLEKLQNKITLTKFKKYINKNLAKRRKNHKKLVEIYNNNLLKTNYLQLISESGIKISNIIKIKENFFSKSSA